MTDTEIAMVQSLTFCSEEVAREALAVHGEVWLAVDSIVDIPVRTKNIRPADTGLDAEQKIRCTRGRELQDKINALFSVAQSQVKTQPLLLAEPEEDGPPQSAVVPVLPESELPQDSLQKMTPPVELSETPQ